MNLIEAFFEVIKQIVLGFFGLLRVIFIGKENDSLYPAKSMKLWDRIRVFSCLNKGIILNGKNKKLSIKNSLTHTIIVGKSGSGKSSTFYNGNLLNPNNKSFVVSDLDGSLFKATSGYLKSINYDIQVLHLGDIKHSQFFNPIHFCTTIDDLKILAEQIITSKSSSEKDKFWDHSATNLLFFLLKLVKTQSEKFQNLANVRHLLSMMELPNFESFMVANASKELWNEFLTIKSFDSKLRTNIQATLSATLDLISYQDISFLTSKNTINFDRLKKPKAILYIIIPERLIRPFSLIISVLYGQLFNHFQKSKPKKNPIFFLLDEAGNYKIKDLDILLSVLRRYNLSVNLAVQNINQIVKLYGNQSFATIFSNCSTKIIFPGTSLELSEQVSRIVGNKSVEISFEGKKQQQTRPVLTPTEIIPVKEKSHTGLVFKFTSSHIEDVPLL